MIPNRRGQPPLVDYSPSACSQVAAIRDSACKNLTDPGPLHGTPLLVDGVVLPSLGFEIDGGLGTPLVEADAEFVTIPIPVDGALIKEKIVRIEVETVHRIRLILLRRPEGIEIEIWTEIATVEEVGKEIGIVIAIVEVAENRVRLRVFSSIWEPSILAKKGNSLGTFVARAISLVILLVGSI